MTSYVCPCSCFDDYFSLNSGVFFSKLQYFYLSFYWWPILFAPVSIGCCSLDNWILNILSVLAFVKSWQGQGWNHWEENTLLQDKAIIKSSNEVTPKDKTVCRHPELSKVYIFRASFCGVNKARLHFLQGAADSLWQTLSTPVMSSAAPDTIQTSLTPEPQLIIHSQSERAVLPLLLTAPLCTHDCWPAYPHPVNRSQTRKLSEMQWVRRRASRWKG